MNHKTVLASIILIFTLFTGGMVFESPKVGYAQFFDNSQNNDTNFSNSTAISSNSTSNTTAEHANSAELVLLSQKLKKASSTGTRELIGETKNIGKGATKGVGVLLTIYDKNGGLIATESTSAASSYLKPGEKTTFKFLGQPDWFEGMDHYELGLSWDNADGTGGSGSKDNVQIYENDTSNSVVEPDNDTGNNNATSNSGLEQMTMKAQLKSTFLKNAYDIKKFRFSVSDGSEICPSNNCEYRVEDGHFYNHGSLGYSLTGKLKVTMPGKDTTKSIFQDFRFRLDKIGEEITNGQKTQTFEGDGTGSGLEYDITNATLQLGKNPTLTIHGERTSSGNFTDENTSENTITTQSETTQSDTTHSEKSDDDKGNDLGKKISGGLGSLLEKASKKLKN